MNNRVQIAVSLDTTGSMYSCLTQVRRRINELLDRLYKTIPRLELAIIVHGDYNDRPYAIKALDFTTNIEKVVRFVSSAEQTNGFGNGGEQYEAVLHNARDLSWDPSAVKSMILIGDEPPHTASYHENKHSWDWKTEAKALRAAGVNVSAVQCLNRSESKSFYTGLAAIGGGFYVSLDQFTYIEDTLLALCYRSFSEDAAQGFVTELEKKGRINRNLDQTFRQILPNATRSVSYYQVGNNLKAVAPGKFQVLHVDTNCRIDDMVKDNGLVFRKGLGYYEFTKKETIQKNKKVVLMEKSTGDLYEGALARELIGLPEEGVADERLKPVALDKYRVFVQSTSNNRKLVGGTQFLYEVDWR